MVSIVVTAFQPALSRLTLNHVFLLKKTAVKIIENTTHCMYGRYEVGMLLKEKTRQFPNNEAMAKHRLQCLRYRLTKPGNEEMASKYHKVMESYISSGFVRKLSEELN